MAAIIFITHAEYGKSKKIIWGQVALTTRMVELNIASVKYKYSLHVDSLMVDRLYKISEKWEIEILDLWSDDGFNDITEEEKILYMADSIHPIKAGYMKWWCPEIERQLLEKYGQVI